MWRYRTAGQVHRSLDPKMLGGRFKSTQSTQSTVPVQIRHRVVYWIVRFFSHQEEVQNSSGSTKNALSRTTLSTNEMAFRLWIWCISMQRSQSACSIYMLKNKSISM